MSRRVPSDSDGGSSGLQRSRSVARFVAPVIVVLALVGIVAVAATGSTPSGSGRSTPPADSLLDTIFSLMLLLLVVGLAAVTYAVVRPRKWSTPRRRNDLGGLATFLAFAFALAVYVRLRGGNLPFDPEQTSLDRGESSTPPPSLRAGSDRGYEFEFAWLPVLVVLVLAVIGVAAFVLSARRKRPSHADPALAAKLALALDLTLDDLRAEADPRRAVIAAYARLERVLAAHGQPRRAADTPEEHVSRALTHLEVERRAVRRLADLFVRAEFSRHEVDARMKDDAIRALEHVRDALRGAEARPETAHLAAGVPA